MSDKSRTRSMPVDSADLSAATPDPAAPHSAVAPLTVGALLAETRTATGRDLADVSREIRVPLRHLMAIEADDHRSLPALPYALGFVKSYARSVGLNAENVAAQFRAETSITPHVPTPLNLEPLAEARLPSRGLAWGSVALLVVLVAGLGLYGAGVFDPAPAVPTLETASNDAENIRATDPALSPPAPVNPAPAAPRAAAPAGQAIPTSGPVVLVAQEDVWVKIYDRTTGRRAFIGLLSAGQRYEVPTDGPPLTLRAGRAGMVQVQVGGVVLPPLGGPVSTIDGVVLTAPALAQRFALPVQPGASQAGTQSLVSPTGD